MALLAGVFAVVAVFCVVALIRFPPNWLFVYLSLLSIAALLWLLQEMKKEKTKGRQR